MVDIRQGQELKHELQGQVSRITRLNVCWINNDELLTIVNEAEQLRSMALWDVRKLKEPIFEEVIDTNPGQTLPFYDNDTKLLYLTRKGEKQVLVYEYLNHEFLYLNNENGAKQYEGSLPGVGYCLLPKTQLDKKGEEFNRMLIMQSKEDNEKISKEDWYNGKQSPQQLEQQQPQLQNQKVEEYKQTDLIKPNENLSQQQPQEQSKEQEEEK